jgi:hypothetical protein
LNQFRDLTIEFSGPRGGTVDGDKIPTANFRLGTAPLELLLGVIFSLWIVTVLCSYSSQENGWIDFCPGGASDRFCKMSGQL